ncbi:hypothetical protein [Acaryochloris sp. IP29b_bin.148]|uniref:hypothetical protein n=1 Tax=Acaryochloris sp. IP29b_bin.148 TaxID=2969218 RepID=UPI00260E55A1|nr:hypothetical protein [Acaryochloris sp. IP29b_bin.148]
MSTSKSLVSLGSCVFVALTAALPFSAQAQGNPSQLGIPEETTFAIITRMSDTVAARISASSCDDTRNLLKAMRKSKGGKTSELSLEGQLLASAQTQPKLKQVVANRVGTALALKLMDCNMMNPDTLGALFDQR